MFKNITKYQYIIIVLLLFLTTNNNYIINSIKHNILITNTIIIRKYV